MKRDGEQSRPTPPFRTSLIRAMESVSVSRPRSGKNDDDDDDDGSANLSVASAAMQRSSRDHPPPSSPSARLSGRGGELRARYRCTVHYRRRSARQSDVVSHVSFPNVARVMSSRMQSAPSPFVERAACRLPIGALGSL